MKSEKERNSLMVNVHCHLSSFLKLPSLLKGLLQHYVAGSLVWRVDVEA